MICLNGPPAHLFQPGDLVISMGMYEEEEASRLVPRVVFVDERNRITKVEEHHLITNEETDK